MFQRLKIVEKRELATARQIAGPWLIAGGLT